MTRWGMIGCGAICGQIAEAASMTPEMCFTAIHGRSVEKVRAFAARWGIADVYEDLDEMLRSEIDVVYIGLPHTVHESYVMRCLDAGVSVICEKPLSWCAESAQRMMRRAREKQVFLMEAMWSRTFPGMQQILQWLPRIGRLTNIVSSFGFRAGEPTLQDRHFDPQLAGGALLDLAVYPLALMRQITGKNPESVQALAKMGPTACDQADSITLRYDDGCLASIQVSFETNMQAFCLYGENGSIEILPDFWSPTRILLKTEEGTQAYEDTQVVGFGYSYELQHVCHCVKNGLTESALVPLQETVDVLQTLDRIRETIGLRYPFE